MQLIIVNLYFTYDSFIIYLWSSCNLYVWFKKVLQKFFKLWEYGNFFEIGFQKDINKGRSAIAFNSFNTNLSMMLHYNFILLFSHFHNKFLQNLYVLHILYSCIWYSCFVIRL
jgi:hypothetical protein